MGTWSLREVERTPIERGRSDPEPKDASMLVKRIIKVGLGFRVLVKKGD